MNEKIPVTSVAIITAQNPFGSRLSYDINHDLNRKLRLELYDANCELMQMEGSYAGNQEHSFLTTNIPRIKLIELAQKYKQKAAIWAFVRTLDEETYLHFQYLENGKTTTGKIVPICASYLESADKLFTAVRTGSFKLPVLENKEEKSHGTEFSFDS